jgi:hypothetical protein
MNRLLTSALVVSLAAICFTTAACESEATEEAKRQAKAVDESYEAEADLKESLAQGGPDENAVHEEAEALRNKGESIKDHLVNELDKED